MGSSSQNSCTIFDELRGCWVAATPEEYVRQNILKRMIHVLHFPKELIAVEKELKELPHLSDVLLPQRRIDILCYGKNIHPQHSLYPLLLIECKKQTIDALAVDQLIGYNAHVRSYFVALASPEEERFGYKDRKTGQYVFYTGFPAFNDLISWLTLQPHT